MQANSPVALSSCRRSVLFSLCAVHQVSAHAPLQLAEWTVRRRTSHLLSAAECSACSCCVAVSCVADTCACALSGHARACGSGGLPHLQLLVLLPQIRNLGVSSIKQGLSRLQPREHAELEVGLRALPRAYLQRGSRRACMRWPVAAANGRTCARRSATRPLLMASSTLGLRSAASMRYINTRVLRGRTRCREAGNGERRSDSCKWRRRHTSVGVTEERLMNAGIHTHAAAARPRVREPWRPCPATPLRARLCRPPRRRPRTWPSS